MSLIRSGSPASAGGLIPAFLSFDVEPDGFQLHRGDPADWAGYDAMVAFAEHLRSELAERSGAAPKFGWYFRTDPQIAEVYGRPDYALTEFSGYTAQLTAKGDSAPGAGRAAPAARAGQ